MSVPINYFEEKHGKKEDQGRVYEPNYFVAKHEEPEEPEYKAQDLMLDRPKAAHTMLKALPESAAELLKNFIRFAADPKGVVTGGVDLAKQTANKAGRKIAEAVEGQEMEVMPERPEIVADTIWEGVKQRLGGGDELATTLMTDPLGLAMDASIFKPLRGLDPMTRVSGTVDKAATAVSKRMYADAVGIPRKIDPERRGELIDVGMNPEARLTANPEGIKNLKGQQAVVAKDINEVFGTLGKVDTFSPSAINQHLITLMKKYEGTSGGNANIAKVQQLRDKLYSEFIYRHPDGSPILGTDGMPVLKEKISAAELQKYKTDAYDQFYKRDIDPSVKVSEGAKTRTIKQQARGAKDELQRAYPELIDPNIEWGKLAQLKPMIERSMERFTEMEAGYVMKMLRDPEWRSKMAIAVRKMADGDVNVWGKELGSADLRIALVLAGRNEEMIDEELKLTVDGVEQ